MPVPIDIDTPPALRSAAPTKLAAAQRGELRGPLSVGYAYGLNVGVVNDPDEQVRGAVEDLFAEFARTGSPLGRLVVPPLGSTTPCCRASGAVAGHAHHPALMPIPGGHDRDPETTAPTRALTPSPRPVRRLPRRSVESASTPTQQTQPQTPPLNPSLLREGRPTRRVSEGGRTPHPFAVRTEDAPQWVPRATLPPRSPTWSLVVTAARRVVLRRW